MMQRQLAAMNQTATMAGLPAPLTLSLEDERVEDITRIINKEGVHLLACLVSSLGGRTLGAAAAASCGGTCAPMLTVRVLLPCLRTRSVAAQLPAVVSKVPEQLIHLIHSCRSAVLVFKQQQQQQQQQRR